MKPALKRRHQATYISLSKQEHLALEQIAYLDGRKINETMRELIRDEAKRRGVWPEIASTTPAPAGN